MKISSAQSLLRKVAIAFGALSLIAVSTSNAACYFRVNGWEPTDEGVLLARYASGVTGSALVASTRYAARDPVAVRAAFQSVRLAFDMNGDNDVNTVDTTIVLRYAAGIRGAALTQGLSLAGGTRSTYESVQAFIDGGCVAPIATRAPLYESLAFVSDRTAFLAQANAQGARSFLYLSPIAVGVEFANLYASETPGVFSYRSLDTPTTPAAFETQLNTQGAERFRFGGVLSSGSYFYRDDNSDRTFSYRVLPLPAASSDFLTQANAEGAAGYFFVLPYFISSASYAIYAKESGAATYSYAVQPSTDFNSTPADFVNQANTQGANGFKFRTSYQFSDGSRNVYVKDTAQSATYTWKTNDNAASVAALVAQANTEGAGGFVYLGARVFFPNGISNPSQTQVVYFRPVNCAGSVMCAPSGPF
jgi:hypothetical protein